MSIVRFSAELLVLQRNVFHVILNQPKSFSEAENLARLRDSVRKTSNASSALSVANPQDQKIKELEGQINLLLSIAKQKNSAPVSQPVQAFDPIVFNQQNQQTQQISEFQSMSEIASASMPDFKNEIIAAIQTGFSNAQSSTFRGNPRQDQVSRGGARGRSLRTMDGQPVCNNCHRVGHVARYCWSRQPQQPQYQMPERPIFQQQVPQQQFAPRFNLYRGCYSSQP